MIKTMDAVLEDLKEAFDLIGPGEDRYRYILELGEALSPLAAEDYHENNRIFGCASRVFLICTPLDKGMRLSWRGDSDSQLVRGLIALVFQLYNGQTPEDILAFDAKAAFRALGLASGLSSQRVNGLASVIARIQKDASGYNAQETH